MRHFAKYINGYIHACTYYNLHVLMNWFWKYSLIIHFIGIFSSFLPPSAWKSLRFIEFEFHRALELGVRTHSEFKLLLFFEFKLEFGDEFSKFWPWYFEYFKFYWIRVCLQQKSSFLSLNFEFRVARSNTTNSCFLEF